MADQQNDLTAVPVVYANNVRLGLSFSDLRLYLGEVIPAVPAGPPGQARELTPAQLQTIDRVCVVMSPDLLPQLVEGLSNAVKAYEAQFGPLRKNPQVQQPSQEKKPAS